MCHSTAFRGLILCLAALNLSTNVMAQIHYSLGDLNTDYVESSQNFGNVETPAELGSHHIFAASDNWNGTELWRSDGTVNGTELFFDLYPGPGSGNPESLTAFDGFVYFTNFSDLYRTDGTTAGTHLFLQHPEYIGDLVKSDTHLYMRTNNGLYVVNGGGTVTLLHGQVSYRWPAGDKLYFLNTSNQLGVTDGTTGGTEILSDHAPERNQLAAAALNNQIIYKDQISKDVWISDGTVAGTTLLIDFEISTSFTPNNFLTFGSHIYFDGYSEDHGTELYKTDGTLLGTTRITDVGAGPTGYAVNKLAASDSHLYFTGYDTTHGRELWVTDGEVGGERLLADITAGSSSSEIFPMGTDGNKFYFLLVKRDSEILYVTDGTTVTELYEFTDSLLLGSETGKKADVNRLATFSRDGYFYFRTREGYTSVDLWRTDGTPAGTELFKQIAVPQTSSVSTYRRPLAGNGDFVISPTQGGDEFNAYATNGSAAGTQKIADTYAYRVHHDEYGTFFSNPSGIWKTDGTTAGTSLFSNLYQYNYSARGFHDFNGEFRFAVRTNILSMNRITGHVSHVVDLAELGALGSVTASGIAVTTEGAWLFTYGTDELGDKYLQLWFGNNDGFSLKATFPTTVTDVDFLVALGDRILFPAYSSTEGMELWQARAAEVSVVKDIYEAEGGGSQPQDGVVIDNILYFHAYNPDYGRELWRSDGTEAGTTMVKDINPGTGSSLIIPFSANTPLFHVLGDYFYFFANDGTHGEELWRSDGTEAGTTLVADAIPGSGDIDPRELIVHGDHLYFPGNTADVGREIWRSDGTEAGTGLFLDTIPGFISGYPLNLISLDSGLVYWRNSDTGFEPYVYRDEPFAGFSSDATFCTNGTGFTATALEDFPGTTYTWTVVGGTITAGQGTRVLTFETGAGADVTLTLEVTADAQTTQSSQTLPLVASAPATPDPIGGVTEVCPEEMGVVFSISPVSGADSYHWTLPAGAQLVSGQGTTDIMVDFGTTAGQVTVVAQNICGDSIAATLDVAITDAPQAYAGAPQTVCDVTTTLDANSAAGSTGTWEILEGEGGNLSDINDPNATFTGTAGNGYRLQWTLEHPTCGTTTSTTYIAFAAATDIADAGPDQDVCGIYALMAANASNSGFGNWEIVSGVGGRFEDVYDPLTQFYGTVGETYTLRWILRSKPCAETSDTMTATFHAGPTVSAGADGSVAAGSGYQLSSLGTPGLWTVESGPSLDASQFDDPTLEGAVFTANGGPGTYVLRRTANYAGCTPLWDEVSVEVLPPSPHAWNLGDYGDPPEEHISLTNPIEMNGWLYFTLENALWRTDGTTQEMVMSLATPDINVIFTLYPFNDQIFIAANLDYEEYELWVTRGRPGTTFKLATDVDDDLVPGTHKMYFRSGADFWETDGSQAGTFKVPGSAPLKPEFVYDGKLFFTAGDELWFGDGTPNNTQQLLTFPNFDDPQDFFVFEGNVYFFQSGGFYKSNGTAAGTVLVRDFNGTAQTRSQFDVPPMVIGDYFFFMASDANIGRELWSSDGTETGTTNVIDLYAGSSGGGSNRVVQRNNLLFFYGNDGSDRGLWVIDALTAEATYLDDIELTYGFEAMGDHVYYTADEPGTGKELWRTDGTVSGTQLVADLVPGTGSSFPWMLAPFNDRLYFVSNHASEVEQFWRTDGTAVGTEPVSTFYSDAQARRPQGVVLNDQLYLDLEDGSNGRQLWLMDGDQSRMVRSLNFQSSQDPRGMTAMGDHVYFIAPNPSQTVVWRTDGTEAGTYPLMDEHASFGDGAEELTTWGNMIAFTWDGPFGQELYLSDGTIEGTRLLTDLRPNGDSQPDELTAWGDYLVFEATDPDGRALYYTDGTEAGTQKLAPGLQPFTLDFVLAGERLFIRAGWELYVMDHPTDTPELFHTGSNIHHVFALGDRLMTIEEEGVFAVLQSYDGTPSGTQYLGAIDAEGGYHFSHANGRLAVVATSQGFATQTLYTDGLTTSLPTYDRGKIVKPHAFGDRMLLEMHSVDTGSELAETDGNTIWQLPELISGPEDMTLLSTYQGENTMYLFTTGGSTAYRVYALSRGEVTLGDLNFRAHLRNTADINGDGLFDTLEAQQTTSLNLQNAEIHSLEGIGAFTRLEALDLRYNPLTDVTPLLDTALGTDNSHSIDLRNNRLDSDDCPTLEQLQARVDLSGASLQYDLQGDVFYHPIPPQWPAADITDMLGGVTEPPETLDCGTRKREFAVRNGGAK